MTIRQKRRNDKLVAQAAVRRAEQAMIAVAWSDADDETFSFAVDAWEAAKVTVKSLGAVPASLPA